VTSDIIRVSVYLHSDVTKPKNICNYIEMNRKTHVTQLITIEKKIKNGFMIDLPGTDLSKKASVEQFKEIISKSLIIVCT
jgi:hypothetical protein